MSESTTKKTGKRRTILRLKRRREDDEEPLLILSELRRKRRRDNSGKSANVTTNELIQQFNEQFSINADIAKPVETATVTPNNTPNPNSDQTTEPETTEKHSPKADKSNSFQFQRDNDDSKDDKKEGEMTEIKKVFRLVASGNEPDDISNLRSQLRHSFQHTDGFTDKSRSKRRQQYVDNKKRQRRELFTQQRQRLIGDKESNNQTKSETSQMADTNTTDGDTADTTSSELIESSVLSKEARSNRRDRRAVRHTRIRTIDELRRHQQSLQTRNEAYSNELHTQGMKLAPKQPLKSLRRQQTHFSGSGGDIKEETEEDFYGPLISSNSTAKRVSPVRSKHSNVGYQSGKIAFDSGPSAIAKDAPKLSKQEWKPTIHTPDASPVKLSHLDPQQSSDIADSLLGVIDVTHFGKKKPTHKHRKKRKIAPQAVNNDDNSNDDMNVDTQVLDLDLTGDSVNPTVNKKGVRYDYYELDSDIDAETLLAAITTNTELSSVATLSSSSVQKSDNPKKAPPIIQLSRVGDTWQHTLQPSQLDTRDNLQDDFDPEDSNDENYVGASYCDKGLESDDDSSDSSSDDSNDNNNNRDPFANGDDKNDGSNDDDNGGDGDVPTSKLRFWRKQMRRELCRGPFEFEEEYDWETTENENNMARPTGLYHRQRNDNLWYHKYDNAAGHTLNDGDLELVDANDTDDDDNDNYAMEDDDTTQDFVDGYLQSFQQYP